MFNTDVIHTKLMPHSSHLEPGWNPQKLIFVQNSKSPTFYSYLRTSLARFSFNSRKLHVWLRVDSKLPLCPPPPPPPCGVGLPPVWGGAASPCGVGLPPCGVGLLPRPCGVRVPPTCGVGLPPPPVLGGAAPPPVWGGLPSAPRGVGLPPAPRGVGLPPVSGGAAPPPPVWGGDAAPPPLTRVGWGILLSK
jgi:hypothetical protein